jgi:hypothetical protein
VLSEAENIPKTGICQGDPTKVCSAIGIIDGRGKDQGSKEKENGTNSREDSKRIKKPA